MSIRTTITLDEDVHDQVKRESTSRGMAFRDTLNDLLRLALFHLDRKPVRRRIEIKPSHMGFRMGLNYDSVESLLEYGEGDGHR